MDSRLKKALDNSKKAQQKIKDEEQRKKDKEYQEHKDFIKSKLPAAQKWIDENLFLQIEEADKSPYSKRVYLKDSYGITAEALYEVAKTIDGLKVVADWRWNSSNPDDYLCGGYFEYYVTWGDENK